MVDFTPSCIGYSMAMFLFMAMLITSVVLVDISGDSNSFNDTQFQWGFFLGVASVICVYIASKIYFYRVRKNMNAVIKAAKLNKSDNALAEEIVNAYGDEMYRYVPILISVVFVGVLYFFWLVFESKTWTRYLALTLIAFTFFLFVYLVIRHLRHTYEIMVRQAEGTKQGSAMNAKERAIGLLTTLEETQASDEKSETDNLIARIKSQNKVARDQLGGRVRAVNPLQVRVNGRRDRF